MTPKDALKWATLYRLGSVGSFLLGMVVVVGGMYVGFGSALDLLLEDPLDPATALAEANTALVVVVALVGFVIWQLGSTAALYYTLTRATGKSAAEQFDPVQLRSEVLAGLDGRLSDLEADIAAALEDGEPDTATVAYEEPEPASPEASTDETPAAEPEGRDEP